MMIACAHLVDPSATRWYRCVTRCVRRAFLLGKGMHDWKSWIEHRLEELAVILSVAVAGLTPDELLPALWGPSSLGRVDLGGCPPRSPTDPDVRVKRIWLFIS